MKIVSVMTSASQGGAEFAAVEMLEALRNRGHETIMLSNQLGIGRNTQVQVRSLEIGPKLATKSWRNLLRRSPRLVLDLKRALEREAPYDVLLVHYKKEQLLVRLLPKRLRATIVWAEWGPVPYPLRKGLPRLAYLEAARHAKVIMAISAGTKRSVCEVGVPEAKVHVVRNVMRSESLGYTEDGRRRVREQLGIPDDAFTVGCISRFHPKKRNDVVVDAVARLTVAPGAQPPHLILAGDGETEPDLRARAAALDGRAHFVPTPGQDVADVISAFDVSVFCPSPTEGEPRAVILGMLAARPCLSTGAEGVSEMISPEIGAIIEPENDPVALAAVLQRYADDPALVERHGQAARRFALETYDAPAVAQRIEKLLRPAIVV